MRAFQSAISATIHEQHSQYHPAAAGSRGNGIPRVIVATTALLTFILVLAAAAIVLNDLASSAYYAAAKPKATSARPRRGSFSPIMVFFYAVRAVYVESCSMFVRGGVYRAVKDVPRRDAREFSVSALMLTTYLTGPISGVAAGPVSRRVDITTSCSIFT